MDHTQSFSARDVESSISHDPTASTGKRRSRAVREPAKPPRAIPHQRFVAPAACDDGYSEAELELIQAMQEYKLSSGRMFPTWSEVLEVIQGLGYRKAEVAEQTATAADLMGRLHAAGWCVGDSGSETEAEGLTWVVIGRRGADVVRGEGATQVEAWKAALCQASRFETSRGRTTRG